ncbi:MAG: alpha/beta fold hydrolase [Proteobacteria bacterium]|nr:MAG: alpha/beta fold hydrolase [Pseudomonadota bacterium]
MIDTEDTFAGTWPFAPHFFDGNGFRMHYVDEQSSGQEVFLCLHGQPTWGYLYRNIIPPLTKYGRVVVPDHMGFGKSETPQDRRYTIEEHCDNLEKLVLDLDLTDITLVLQDWGGPIGGSIAYRHPHRVKRICAMDAIVGGRAPAQANTIRESPWFQWVNSPAFEPTIRNLSATALSVMKRVGFERTAQVDETWVRAYAAPFPTPESCEAAFRFPQCIADRETVDFLNRIRTPSAVDAVKQKPAMYIHGEADRALPLAFAVGCFKDMWPAGPVVTLPGVGHFLQEDAPETVAALICQFVQMT